MNIARAMNWPARWPRTALAGLLILAIVFGALGASTSAGCFVAGVDLS